MTSRRTYLKGVGLATALATVPGMTAAKPGKGGPRGTLYNLTFDDDSDTASWTADSPGWQVDRAAPETWERATGNPHNNTVRKNMDESGDTSGFHRFQGMKYLDAGGESWHAEIPRRLKATGTVFIDSAWEADDEQRRTGLWYALGNADGDWTWFEILEYRSSAVNGGTPGLYRFGSVNGYEELDLPKSLNPERGGRARMDLRMEPGPNETTVEWRVNGARVLDSSFGNPYGDTDHFMDFFVNSVNYGVDQDYYYDGFHTVIT